MSEAAFFRLQYSLVKGVDFDDKDLKPALMYMPESPESFSTFTRALMKNVVDPTELFVLSSLLAIEVDSVYVRYSGLGLRYGGNPNSYITADFDFDDETISVPVHIAKKIWDITPRSIEDSLRLDMEALGDIDDNLSDDQLAVRYLEKQRASLDVLSMMSIKGFVPDAKITTATLLTKSNINATRFANLHPEFFSSVYGEIRTSDDLGKLFAQDIKYFEEWKGSLQNAYGRNRDRDSRITEYSLYLDHYDVLALPDVYRNMTIFKLMFFFQDTEALKLILPRLKDLKLIGLSSKDYYVDEMGNKQAYVETSEKKETEMILLDWVISYYTLPIFRLLLELGVVPDYSFRSQVIRASRAICERYPLQCQILNTMIVDFVRTGYGLDKSQLEELAFSPSTVSAVRKEYSVPAWQYMCKVRSGDINPYMKEIGRQAGIPVGVNKNQMCNLLEEMIESNPTDLKKASYEVNRNKISLAAISPADVASGRKALTDPRVLPSSMSVNNFSDKTIPAAESEPMLICSNYDSLSRPIEDFPAIDRVTYSDGQMTWCFTSENFNDLLKTGINPWAIGPNGESGAPIPEEILIEIKQKSDAIKRENLLETPGSLSEGIDAVFDSNPATTVSMYELESNNRLEKFYEFAEGYGIDRSIFSTLNSADYQILADNILNPNTRVTIDKSSPGLALRDFASAVLLEAVNFKNRDQLGQTMASVLL